MTVYVYLHHLFQSSVFHHLFVFANHLHHLFPLTSLYQLLGLVSLLVRIHFHIDL